MHFVGSYYIHSGFPEFPYSERHYRGYVHVLRYKRARGEGPPLKFEWNYVFNIRSQFQSYILAAGWTSSVLLLSRYMLRRCLHVCWSAYRVSCRVRAPCCHNEVGRVVLVCYLLANQDDTQYTCRQVIPGHRLVLSSVTLYSLESFRLFSVYSRFSANSVLVSHGRHNLMLRQFVPLALYRVFYFSRRVSRGLSVLFPQL